MAEIDIFNDIIKIISLIIGSLGKKFYLSIIFQPSLKRT